MEDLLGAVTGGGGGGARFCGVEGGMAGLAPGIGGTRLDLCEDITGLFGEIGDVSEGVVLVG